MINFKQVAHHYIGCEAFWGENGVSSTYTKKIDGYMLEQADWIKPVLKPLEEMTDEVFERDYEKFEKLEADCQTRQDAVKCIAAMFSQMCKDGFDVFGLIPANEAVSIK